MKRSLADSVLGFGAVYEYPVAYRKVGRGDIDSGPLVLGYAVSATGFSREFFAEIEDTVTRWLRRIEKEVKVA